MSFEANEGQLDSRVQFASRGRGYSLFLIAGEAVMTLRSPTPLNKDQENVAGLPDAQPLVGHRAAELQSYEQIESGSGDGTHRDPRHHRVLRMKLVGANRSSVFERIDELPGKSNYFIGNDPKTWRTGVSNYAKIRYRSVYPGIDLVYHGEQGKLEYDFNVAPGANPKAIRLAFAGLGRVRMGKNGDLIIGTPGREVRQQRPIASQEVTGAIREIGARYTIKGKHRVGFKLGEYDASKPLIIDPVLSYSTYLGGSGDESGYGISLDTAGSAYVAGFTESFDFPTKNAFQSAARDESVYDAFVTKLNSTGTALVYSTYLGGSDSGQAFAIAVDSAGSAYVTGYTWATDFPIVNAVQPTKGAGYSSDAFVAKISASGSALVYSTFLGGSSGDYGYGIALDSAGAAYVTGFTRSPDFPTASPLQPALLGRTDAFVTKLNPAGSLAYSTYLGGNGGEAGVGIAVDSFGQAYLAGSTSSPDFPLQNPLQPDFKGRTVFKATSSGGQWASINNGLPVNASVNALAVDPTTPSTVYAGTAGAGIFKSIDNGGTWASANTGLAGLFIDALEVDPKDSTVVFASAGAGVYKSTNSGSSWDFVNFGNTPSLNIDPSNSSIVYAAWVNGISKTTDGGATWTDIPVQPPGSGQFAYRPRAIAIDPVTPTTLYVASSDNLIYKSTDGGSRFSWQLLSNGLFYGGYDCLAIDPTNTATIYAGAQRAGIFKSTDGGQNWTRSFFFPGIGSVNSLAIDPVSPSVVYGGTFGSNVFKTTDAGMNWIAARSGLTNSFVYALAIDPLSTSTIYAGTEAAGEGFVLKLNASGSSLLYSTFLGGDEADYCSGIAIDDSGSAYLTGSTYSRNFPTAHPLQSSANGSYDAFVAKLSPSGSALVYSTYLGGTYEDYSYGITLDAGGNAYVTGLTRSMDFPVVHPTLGSAGDFEGNAFVAKIDPTGTRLIYSTYLGGVDPPYGAADQGNAIAVDSFGNVYVTGQTSSNQFPTTQGAFQSSLHGFSDAFVSKVSTYDVCLQDETNSGNFVLIDTTTGDFIFYCKGSIVASGRGTLHVRGSMGSIEFNKGDRRVYIQWDTTAQGGKGSGTAVVQSGGNSSCQITDKDMSNNICIPAGPSSSRDGNAASGQRETAH